MARFHLCYVRVYRQTGDISVKSPVGHECKPSPGFFNAFHGGIFTSGIGTQLGAADFFSYVRLTLLRVTTCNTAVPCNVDHGNIHSPAAERRRGGNVRAAEQKTLSSINSVKGKQATTSLILSIPSTATASGSPSENRRFSDSETAVYAGTTATTAVQSHPPACSPCTANA